jgi:hypothetical protein
MADAEDPIMQDTAPDGTVEVEVETEPVPDGTVEAAAETDPVSAASVNASVTVTGEANPSTTDTAIATDTVHGCNYVDATGYTCGYVDTIATATRTPSFQVSKLTASSVEGDIEGLALTKEEAEYRDAAMAMDISGPADPTAQAEAPGEGQEPSTDATQIWGPADPDVLSVSRIESSSLFCMLFVGYDVRILTLLDWSNRCTCSVFFFSFLKRCSVTSSRKQKVSSLVFFSQAAL